jgi:uncharacterized membrane protein YeaQ/YmgE (transglycosylase-associated protein family)
MTAATFGAVCFGLVVGFVTYRTLRRQGETVSLSNLAAVIGAIGGGIVTGLFDDKTLFGYYSMGLAGGFFGYLLLAVTVLKNVPFLGDGS